jgi:hypothetical protein
MKILKQGETLRLGFSAYYASASKIIAKQAKQLLEKNNPI